jgi:hypothetical protein
MKPLIWIGLVVLFLGIVSLIVPIPRSEKEGFKVGGVSVGVETSHEEKVSPLISAVMIRSPLLHLRSGEEIQTVRLEVRAFSDSLLDC